MQKFSFNYDLENDDLFVYLEGKTSFGAVELGDFVLDFDQSGNLVAMQILNTSQVLNKILTNIIDIRQIKEIRLSIINFRNMDSIKFAVLTDSGSETANIIIPHIKEKSPVLNY